MENDEQKKEALQKAARLLEEAIKLAPDSPDYKNNYALLLSSKEYLDTLENDEEKRKALEKAAKLLEEAIELSPNDPSYKINLLALFFNNDYFNIPNIKQTLSNEKYNAQLQEAIKLGKWYLEKYNPNDYLKNLIINKINEWEEKLKINRQSRFKDRLTT